MLVKESKLLWQPDENNIRETNLAQFMFFLAEEYDLNFPDYARLYEWSVTSPADFWESFWKYSGIIHSQSYDQVLASDTMFDSHWFRGARLNFAENLLRFRDDRPALIARRENRPEPTILSYAELHKQVQLTASAMRKSGVAIGDRVAAFIPNIPEAVIAMLAATSIGAVYSSCSPDFGVQSLIDRFGQIKPKLLITADSYSYNGKIHDSLEKVRQLCRKVAGIEQVVVVDLHRADGSGEPDHWTTWEQFLNTADSSPLQFEQLPFDHPVYIMYSSGTTGTPKCIVHGAGGTLLQHAKEHRLHTNLNRDDLLFYFTTTGWMMWNWLVGSLSTGNGIYLYDGSPSYPDLEHLFAAVESERISVFGTSPKFLSACQNASLSPKNKFDLSSLKAMLSTGAPLSDENFKWVYQNVKADLQLSSISGGTDILSCFMLGNPTLPVRSGEIQCRGLGMSVEAYDDRGKSLIDKVGELVCTKPFPSMPVSFWNDSDRTKYYAAYFDHYKGLWRHGDYIRITAEGGVVVYGRSDATLNPGGVRIGTAEIYNPVEEIREIEDSIVIGHRIGTDVEIVLFVVTAKDAELTPQLKETIRDAIKKQATPRHLPARIIAVPQIPHTLNGKKVEIAVSRVIHGQEVPNREALANPEALDQIRECWNTLNS
ncbi:MAG: acetoacetate--CoA ligase [bacterium]|nr:acetoacetate--CoA ligase [bacterium]